MDTTNLSAPAERNEYLVVEDLVDHLPDAFVALDATGIIRNANQAILDLVSPEYCSCRSLRRMLVGG